MSAEPQINPAQAWDLGDRAYVERTRQELEQARAERTTSLTIEEWERRMVKTFKGLGYTRKQRRDTLARIGKAMQDGTHGPRETHDRKPRNRGGGPYLRPVAVEA